MSQTLPIQAIIWDFGGVLTSSPFEAFARYELENGLPKDFIRRVNSINPDTNAWAMFEQARLTEDEFDAQFLKESAHLGHRVSGRDVLALLSGTLRPNVVTALKMLATDFKVGCITNNVPVSHGDALTAATRKSQVIADVMAIFDHVLESAKIGFRKPDPKIYALMCEALDVKPAACVYIDDLGINLKPARQMGMRTIKVLDEAQLLADLGAVLGRDLANLPSN